MERWGRCGEDGLGDGGVEACAGWVAEDVIGFKVFEQGGEDRLYLFFMESDGKGIGVGIGLRDVDAGGIGLNADDFLVLFSEEEGCDADAAVEVENSGGGRGGGVEDGAVDIIALFGEVLEEAEGRKGGVDAE